MKWFVPVALFFSFQTAHAQLGMTVASTSSFSPKWQILAENFVTEQRTNFLEYGVTGVVDYRLPLRIDGLSFQPAVHGMSGSYDYFEHHFRIYSVGFQPNLSFDFSHKNKSWKKPFRPTIQLSPGIDFIHKQFDRPVEYNGQYTGRHESFSNGSMATSLGLNFLLDIKLSTLLSVAPHLGYRYYPNITWEGFTRQVSNGQIEGKFDQTSWRQLTFGLRIGLDLENGVRR